MSTIIIFCTESTASWRGVRLIMKHLNVELAAILFAVYSMHKVPGGPIALTSSYADSTNLEVRKALRICSTNQCPSRDAARKSRCGTDDIISGYT